MWRRAVWHPLRIVGLAIGLVLVAASVTLGGLALRNLRRLDHIEARMAHAIQLRRLSARLSSAVLDRHQGTPVDTATLQALSADIASLPNGSDGQTAVRLARLRDLLRSNEMLTEQHLTEALQIARDVTGADLAAQEELFERSRRDARFEFELALAVLGGLILLSTFVWWRVRHRVLNPLDNLRELFTLLANGDFSAVSAEHADPILRPLFDNYNYLVTRLRTLEEEHRLHAHSLEEEVRKATQTLLEQHRSLADAERLAVVGEMAAGVAHELRNPLAGISMSLVNLRREASDPDVVNRLDVIVGEIDRVTRLLGQYLASARHGPEALRPVDVAVLVDDLIELLRYQVPEHITLSSDVPEELHWALPRDRIRQVLLNLVLNGVQALGDAPGSIHVDVHCEDSSLSISVSDDGPGLPPEQLTGRPRAFVTQRATGTGLGLIMVRRVVEELGGTLQFRNLEPRGARITLTLPSANG